MRLTLEEMVMVTNGKSQDKNGVSFNNSTKQRHKENAKIIYNRRASVGSAEKEMKW